MARRARVLEVGCGDGAATKLIMQHVRPAQLVGIDPSPVFIEMAGTKFAGEAHRHSRLAPPPTGQAEAFF